MNIISYSTVLVRTVMLYCRRFRASTYSRSFHLGFRNVWRQRPPFYMIWIPGCGCLLTTQTFGKWIGLAKRFSGE